MLDVFVARQPIFDREDRLVAYELLYRRNPSDTTAVGISSAQMSTDTVAQALLGMGLERVTGGRRAFVNVDREVLLDERFAMLDPSTVVLELLEKSPDDRPQSARQLANRLEGSSLAHAWTPELAARWWQRHAPAGAHEPVPHLVRSDPALA